MKKKCLSCLVLAVLLLAALVPDIALADFDFSTIGTPYIIVIDANDLSASSPIYERSADERLYPASTTKMLTCLLALEHTSLDTEVTVGEEIRGFFETKKGYTIGPSGSSLMGLVVGETVTIRDLLHGLMLSSGNDAADAVAVAVGGTIENFVSMMNARATELGMTGSHFTNPNGVHSDEHYSTARDMAKLAAYAMTNPEFAEIVRTASYTVPANDVRSEELHLVNSNFLLTAEASSKYASFPYQYCIGIKTGMTPRSGYCLVAAAEKDGAKTIVCLYGDPSDGPSSDRFANAKRILEEVFESAYVTVDSSQLTLQDTFSCVVPYARPEDVDESGQIHITINPGEFSIRTLPEEAQKIIDGSTPVTAEVQWIDPLSAPLRQGQQIGIVNYRLGNKTLYTAVLTSPQDILEVAVIPTDSGSAEGAANSLLTAPVETKPPAEKSSPSTFVIILVILIAVLVIALILVLVISARQNKKKKRRKASSGSSRPTNYQTPRSPRNNNYGNSRSNGGQYSKYGTYNTNRPRGNNSSDRRRH